MHNVKIYSFIFHYENSKCSTTKAVFIYLTLHFLDFVVFGILAVPFQYFWDWYVPIFWKNAPDLSYWHAFATVAMLSFLLTKKE